MKKKTYSYKSEVIQKLLTDLKVFICSNDEK